MKHLITATILATLISTTAKASILPPEVTDQVLSQKECSNSSIAIGVGLGAIATIGIAVTVVATSPIVGASAAAGATVGLSGAFSAPFLIGSTLSTIAWSSVIVGPLLATTGAYLGCVYDAMQVE